MRPIIENSGEKVFECFSCGARTTVPSHGACPSCGSEVMNLGQSRDL